MPRRRKQADAPAEMSPLPEKFEDFAAQHPELEAGVNETTKPPEPKQKVRPMGGMVEGKWSGIPIWTCPRCRSTTFDARDARNHTCKQVKFADDETA